jgi:hypothetical protein
MPVPFSDEWCEFRVGHSETQAPSRHPPALLLLYSLLLLLRLLPSSFPWAQGWEEVP